MQKEHKEVINCTETSTENKLCNINMDNCDDVRKDYNEDEKLCKVNCNEINVNKSSKHEDVIIKQTNNNTPDLEKCDICGQFLNNSDILFYQGHPQDAIEEFIALTNEKLVLASGIFISSFLIIY